jgi:hypothetical protein
MVNRLVSKPTDAPHYVDMVDVAYRGYDQCCLVLQLDGIVLGMKRLIMLYKLQAHVTP